MNETFIPFGVHRDFTQSERKFIGMVGNPPTKREILERLEKDEIYMGKNPNRTFIYYQELGLIPTSKGRRGKEQTFDFWTHSLIKSIRRATQAGHSLYNIRLGIEASKGVRCKTRGLIANIIKRKQAYTPRSMLSMLGGYLGIPYYHTISPGGDGIEIFKIESKTPYNFFTLIKDISISVVKVIPLEEYGEIIKARAIDIAKKEGMLLQPEFVHSSLLSIDFPKTLFEQYDGFGFMEKEKF
jgi:hypothetical protein